VKCALQVRAYYTFLVAITVLRVRALFGRVLVLLRLREGPPVKKDIHFEKRVTALQTVGYSPPVGAGEEDKKGIKR